jgi:hypothetical protein
VRDSRLVSAAALDMTVVTLTSSSLPSSWPFALARCRCRRLSSNSAEAGVPEDGCEAGDEGSGSQGDDYPLTTRGGTQRAVALSATRTHERTFVGLQQYYTWTWTASGIENAPHHNQTEGAVRLSKQGHRSTAERLSGP